MMIKRETHIHTLPDNDLQVVRPIPVTIKEVAPDAFLAAAVEKSAHASGDTFDDALDMLRNVVAWTYKRYSSLPAGRLGFRPTRQLATLKQYIRQNLRSE